MYIGLDKARKIAEKYRTPRFNRLKSLECWVDGTQYDGRPSWWTGGAEEVPLWERKPCYVYPAVDNAIKSNTDLVLGEGRYPTITSRPDEDEDDEHEGFDDNGLDEDDSSVLDRFLREHHKISRFKAHAKEAFSTAQGSGTAVAVHGHRNGKPFAELIPARWCTPKFDAGGNVSELEVKYTYFEEVKLPDGRWQVKAMLFRRLITDDRDTTFLPAEGNEQGVEPSWVADPAQTVHHGLGFCPVVWYPFMKGCGPVNEIDGKPIHLGKTDEIEALDISLSMKHRIAVYSEPQLVEIGVDPEHNPTGEMGRQAMVESTERGGLKPGAPGYQGGDPGATTGAFAASKRAAPARKKGSTFVWRYPDPDTKVESIGIPGDVLKNLEDHSADLLAKLEESLGVVLPRPSQFKFAGAVSGKSVVETKQRQYDRCDQYRDDLEDNFLIPSVNMQLRIAQRARDALKVPGVRVVLPILDRFAADA